MTNYSDKLYFPRDVGETKDIYFKNCLLYREESKMSKAGKPYIVFTYAVQLLGSDKEYELSVFGNLHEKIQITRPAPQDKCTLFKLRTARGLADSIQFPAITHAHMIQPEQAPVTQKQESSFSSKDVQAATIGVSWALGILHPSLTPAMAVLSNSASDEQAKSDANNLISTRVQLLLSIRDREVQNYIRLLMSKDVPLPAEVPSGHTPSGINLADIPF
jgi:hypothetical protein